MLHPIPIMKVFDVGKLCQEQSKGKVGDESVIAQHAGCIKRGGQTDSLHR